MMQRKTLFFILKSSVQNTLLFRGSFFLKMLTVFLAEVFSIISMLIILSQFQGYGDISSGQFLFLYFFAHLSYSICMLVFNNLRSMGQYIQSGMFDRMLLMPVNTIAYVCSYNFDFSVIGQVVTGIILFLFFGNSYGIEWSAGSVLMTAIFLLCSVLILASILIVLSSMAYHVIDWKPLDNMFGAFKEMLWYPINIYNEVVKIILYSLVPLAYIAFIPMQMVYNFYSDLVYGLPIALGMLVISILLFGIAYKVWYWQAQKYQSVG